MEKNKLIAILVVVVLAVAAVGAVVVLRNDDKGAETVTLGFYAGDAECKQFLDDYFIPLVKEKHNIDIKYGEYYGPTAAAKVKEEMDAGVTSNGTIDLIWGNISPIETMVPNGQYKYMYDQNWVSSLPNAKYLSTGAESTVKAGIPGYKEGTAMEFSNGQTMLIYNTDFNAYEVTVNSVTFKMPYNCVALVDNGAITAFVKVAPAGTGVEYDGTSKLLATAVTSESAFNTGFEALTAYDIDSMRTAIKGEHSGTVKGFVLYGLPNNFTELLNWASIYNGQITYPDPANAAATFHSNLLFQAAIYELTWNNDKTGWMVAPDRAANVAKVNAAMASITSQEKFDENFGYLYKYLGDLDEYTNKKIGYISAGYIGDINGKIVGNATTDKDYSEDTVMIAMTTVLSVDMRTSTYQYPLGTFSLDTGVRSQYYMSIPANSSHKDAAMKVANEFLDPAVQAEFFKLTGNGYNIDTSKKVDGSDKTIYEEYFGFTEEWSLYLPSDRLEDVTVNDLLTGLAKYIVKGWTDAKPTW